MAVSLVDMMRDYTNLYDVVSYQIETELVRTRQRLMDEELDRQIQEAERVLANIRPNFTNTTQDIEDMLIYGNSIQTVGEDAVGETIVRRVDPRTTISNGRELNLIIGEEAGELSLGSGLESQISRGSYTTGTTLTEEDVRSYMDMLSSRSSIGNRPYEFVAYTGTGGMQNFQDTMRTTINRQWTTGDYMSSTPYFMGTDIVDLMDEVISYKGSKIEITEKDSKVLKVYINNMVLTIPESNNSIYREALLQAKMEKFIGVNGFKWQTK